MKTWITYLAALLFGLATALLFGDMAAATNVVSSVAGYIMSLGVFVTIPLIVFSFTSGIASLRKDKIGGKAAQGILLWAVFTSLLMPIVAGFLFSIYPIAFPVSSSAGNSNQLVPYLSQMATSSLASSLQPVNPFYTAVISSNLILPLVIVAWIFGYSMKPNADTIRPAYAVMNSFSEVMFRISRFYTVYGFILVFFTSADFFMKLYQEKTMQAAPIFFLEIVLIVLAMLLGALPLLYAIATRFKKNPYSAIYRSIAPLFAALTTGNILFSMPMNVTIARHNLGIQKRIGATASPFFALIGRGGTASISTVATLSLIYALTGNISSSIVILVALSAFLVSFTSFMALGYEVVLAIYFILKLLGIELYGAEVAAIALVPLLNGVASMLDAAIMALGCKITGFAVDTDIETPYQDQI